MEICIVSGIFPPKIGGPATYSEKLMEMLKARGHSVRVITYGSSSSGQPDLCFVNEDLPAPIKIALATWQTIARTKDSAVILATDPVIAGIPAFLAARYRRKPFVLRLVGDFAWENSVRLGWIPPATDVHDFQRKSFGLQTELLRWTQKAVARRATKIIVPSEYNRKLWQAWGIDKSKITKIENAVEPPKELLTRKDLGLPSNRKIVLTAGRLLPFKRIDCIIKAVAALDNEKPLLVVIGEGEYEATLKALVKEKNLDAKFLKRVPHKKIFSYLGNCDVFVLFSSYEGQSHLLLEAMAVGAPIVASATLPNQELLRENVDALLAVDETGLCAKLDAVLRDPAMAKRLSANAQQKARGFSWPKTYAGTVAVLEEAAK